jgi:hypothetical protein
MFFLAIKHKDDNTPHSLIVKILLSLLPICTYFFDIVSIIIIFETTSKIIKNDSPTMQSLFWTKLRCEYYDTTNSECTSYKSKVATNEKDLLADFSDAIIKIRRDPRPDRVLNINDISSI